MRFQELLDDSTTKDPGQQRRWAKERFPAEVRSHGLRLWHPGDPWNTAGERFLLGVAAAYSVHDLMLMDDLEAGIRKGGVASTAVDIFDISDVRNAQEFEAYIPGITPVTQSPILGIWADGMLKERFQGFRARQRLLHALSQADSTG